MEGVLSNITFSEVFPITLLGEQQPKKIKLQNSSYNNITKKYEKESENNTLPKFSESMPQEQQEESTVFANSIIKEPVSLPSLKEVIELVKYQDAPAPIQGNEYRPIKISASMENNIINNYNNTETGNIDNYKVDLSNTDVISKASKKYADIDSEDVEEKTKDTIVAPERNEINAIESENEQSSYPDGAAEKENKVNEEINDYSHAEETENTQNSDANDEQNDENMENYGKLIEKLKQERDAAAKRAETASSSYNETKAKLAEAADKYVAILKEQTATLNHEAESSEQKASDCKEQLETMLAEIDKVATE